jgi:hypothetical protein
VTIVETIKIGRSHLPNDRQRRDARKELGYAYTHGNVHRNARSYDFVCMTHGGVKRMLEGAMR